MTSVSIPVGLSPRLLPCLWNLWVSAIAMQLSDDNLVVVTMWQSILPSGEIQLFIVAIISLIMLILFFHLTTGHCKDLRSMHLDKENATVCSHWR